MREQALQFGSAGSLVGILTEPSETVRRADRAAVILLGAGIVHRVGPHRLYVKLARTLAEMGLSVFRFDFSGIGDSDVRRDNLPLETCAVDETREAMDCVASMTDVNRFILLAICSGAGFSFRTACTDERVVGVGLINAAGHRWGTDEELNGTVTHHYRRMLWSPSFRAKNWRKLTTLAFDGRSFRHAAVRRMRSALSVHAARKPPAALLIAKEFESLVARGVHVLVVYSEGDEGWDYYQVYLRDNLRSLESNSRFGLKFIPGANHTFTLLSHQRELFGVVGAWIERIG